MPEALLLERLNQDNDMTDNREQAVDVLAWQRRKPTRPGVYAVRGFNFGEPPEFQFEAAVLVRRNDDDELVTNLHESTSEDDLDRWGLVEDCSDDFEWLEFEPAARIAPREDAQP